MKKILLLSASLFVASIGTASAEIEMYPVMWAEAQVLGHDEGVYKPLMERVLLFKEYLKEKNSKMYQKVIDLGSQLSLESTHSFIMAMVENEDDGSTESKTRAAKLMKDFHEKFGPVKTLDKNEVAALRKQLKDTELQLIKAIPGYLDVINSLEKIKDDGSAESRTQARKLMNDFFDKLGIKKSAGAGSKVAKELALICDSFDKLLAQPK